MQMSPQTFAFVALLMLAVSTNSLALSCASDDRSLEQAVLDSYKASDLVAVVEVIAIERKTAEFTWGKEPGVWAKLLPRYVFKGAAAPDWVFYAAAPICGPRIEPTISKGQLLLVYAHETEPFRGLHSCSSSGDLIAHFNELPILFHLTGREWVARPNGS
jgi:hypothetical protein